MPPYFFIPQIWCIFIVLNQTNKYKMAITKGQLTDLLNMLEDNSYYWVQYTSSQPWEIGRYIKNEKKFRFTDGSSGLVTEMDDVDSNPIINPNK